jgi:hypothetical protein
VRHLRPSQEGVHDAPVRPVEPDQEEAEAVSRAPGGREPQERGRSEDDRDEGEASDPPSAQRPASPPIGPATAR